MKTGRSMCAARCVAAILFLTAATGWAALTNATWLGGVGNWTDGTQWSSSPLYPQNAGSLTWDVTVPSGTATLDTTIVIWQFDLAGTMDGDFSLTANGPMNWTSGEMSGTGNTIANGGLTIAPEGGYVVLNARSLQLAAATTLTNGNLYGRNGATLTNQPGATFDIVDDSGVVDYQSGATPQFLNAGTLRKSGTAGIGSAFSWMLINSGTVEVRAGVLRLSAGYQQTAGTTRLSGGDLFCQTPFDLTAGSLTGCGFVDGGMTIGAGATIIAACGTALEIAGTVTNNGTITVGNSTILDFDGPVINNGTILATGGTVHFFSTLENNGTLITNGAPVDLARVLGLFNTGVDAAGNLLTNSAVDPHYALIQNPETSNATAYVANATNGWWYMEGTNSLWLGPTTDADTAGMAAGDYVYRTTFDLTGFDPATCNIYGIWASDNAAIDIFLNGASTGNHIPMEYAFTSLHSLSISGGFLPGTNTLDFVVNNIYPSPTGLRVELHGTAKLLPVHSLARAGTNVVIQFVTGTSSNATYGVDRSDKPTGPSWDAVTNGLAGTGGIISVTDIGAATQPKRFYRVRLTPTP